MFVKHIIENPTCFGHNCLTIFRGPSEDGQTIVTETCTVF